MSLVADKKLESRDLVGIVSAEGAAAAKLQHMIN